MDNHPHGAGRKRKRGEAGARQRPEDLLTTALGGQAIREDRALLYDEAPEKRPP